MIPEFPERGPWSRKGSTVAITTNTNPASLDYVRVFLRASQRYLAEVLGEVPKRGQPVFQVDASLALQEINISIGVTGDLRGLVNFGMDKPTLLAIASTMMMENCTELDELSISAVMELSNIISGNARTGLSELGKFSDITPPTYFAGKAVVGSWHRMRAMSVPMILSKGTVFVTVGIRPRHD